MADPVLCYVDGHFAYFTTRPLAEQWGDDWDDAPYEHNAGEPYAPMPRYFANGTMEKPDSDFTSDGDPRWEIICVAWRGDFDAPSANYLNSPYSVQQINAGAVAWLNPPRWVTNKNARPIPAGTTLPEFKRLIAVAGGEVYEAAK